MDLTLADDAFEMLEGSVKPSQSPYDWFITHNGLAKSLSKSNDGIYELKRQKTYVFRLQEKLEISLRNGGVIYGQATAKSSIGRVDVLARLIVDGMTTYESFDPDGLLKGSEDMFSKSPRSPLT